jgi:hypothetical protein
MSQRRRAIWAIVATLAMSMALVAAPAARAQEETSDAFCALLTVDEVSEALGDQVVAESSFESCNWYSDDAEGSFVFLSAYWDSLPFAERTADDDGVALTVGGRAAWYVDELQVLYIQFDQGVLALQLSASAEGSDLRSTLVSLGEIAVSRAGSLPPPATPEPPPSFASDPDLEALFPDAVGGQSLSIQSMTGADIIGSGDPDDPSRQRLEQALALQGKTLADVSVAYAFSADGAASILAFRIRGGDAAALAPILVPIIAQDQEFQQAASEVAGKAVIVFTSEDGSDTAYVYTSGEVVWIVTATEPALTEIFTALP